VVDGQIVGMLYVGMPEKDLDGTKVLFSKNKFFDTGYPYIVGADGMLIVHPTDEGKSIENEDFFKEMLRHKSGVIEEMEYVWQGQNQFQYYKYHEPIDAFVGANFYISDMNEILNRIRITIIIVTVLAFGIVLLVLRFFCSDGSKVLEKRSRFCRSGCKWRLNGYH